jgi:hypothetical protein
MKRSCLLRWMLSPYEGKKHEYSGPWRGAARGPARSLPTWATAAKQAGARLGTSGGTTTTIKEVYALGHLAEQTDSAGNMLASFTYDVTGTPTSVVLGNPNSGPRYYYAYDPSSARSLAELSDF